MLLDAARELGVPVLDARTSAAGPLFSWDLDQCALILDGRHVSPTAAFLRMDVFAALDDRRVEVSIRAAGWYQAVSGWLASEKIRTFNRGILNIAGNKPAVLRLAAARGLRTPATLVTNDISSLGGVSGQRIAKPVAGGGYCLPLERAIAEAGSSGGAAMPAIVQPRLVPPEVRIYVVGEETFAFEMASSSLDYRELQDVEVSCVPPPPETTGLRDLMAALGMDFGAADFKTDPETGRLVFLELNTSPMFARFDAVAEGRLCRAMVRQLTNSVPKAQQAPLKTSRALRQRRNNGNHEEEGKKKGARGRKDQPGHRQH